MTPEGHHVFLELNPAGQWLFMEERTSQPMTDTFVSLLALTSEEAASQQRDDCPLCSLTR